MNELPPGIDERGHREPGGPDHQPEQDVPEENPHTDEDEPDPDFNPNRDPEHDDFD